MIHICKKTCFKSTVSVDTGDEYKDVCISSPDSRRNIYEYCENKMQKFSLKSKESCKLDMCNLCCITMDAVRSKSYSIKNLTNCYNDCNRGKCKIEFSKYKFYVFLKINDLLFNIAFASYNNE